MQSNNKTVQERIIAFAKMMSSSSNRENPDLKKERAKCSFSREEITNLIDGGPNKTQRRRDIGKLYHIFLLHFCGVVTITLKVKENVDISVIFLYVLIKL